MVLPYGQTVLRGRAETLNIFASFFSCGWYGNYETLRRARQSELYLLHSIVSSSSDYFHNPSPIRLINVQLLPTTQLRLAIRLLPVIQLLPTIQLLPATPLLSTILYAIKFLLTIQLWPLLAPAAI